ncbi:MAG: flagellar basal body L-ring protein FlgH [Gammaproteobacteria bacterium]
MNSVTNNPSARRLLPVVMLVASTLSQVGCGTMKAEESMRTESNSMDMYNYGRNELITDGVNGSIFQSSTSLALFEDQKAKRIGDILTINLVEATNATKSSSTNTSKSTAATIANPTVLGYDVTRDGVPILSGSLGGDTEFTGEGGASQSNRLEGSVTVTVIDRMPNGNLVVRGEKWLTLNQGKEFVRVSGIVRPVDILADNSISSEKIANARIEYAGKGPLADANRMSWLARFFNSPWIPF